MTDAVAAGRRRLVELSHQLGDGTFLVKASGTALGTMTGDDLVAGGLFPDQVVVCGALAPLVPYAEPGLPLARAVRRALAEHLEAHGSPPRLVHLANHARVLSAALAVGSPRYLDPDTVHRLGNRADEKHRHRLLAAETPGESPR